MANYIRDIMYVAKAVPATNTAAGFEALTWVKVNGIQSLPNFGVSHGVIDVEDLESGFTSGEKGAASGIESDVACHTIAGDAGQADLKLQADDSAGLTSLKIVRKPSGASNTPATGDAVEYAHGFLHSFTPTENNVSTHVGFSTTFRQNALTVTSTEPA